MSQWQEANPHAPLTGLSLYPVAACSSTAVNNIQDRVKTIDNWLLAIEN